MRNLLICGMVALGLTGCAGTTQTQPPAGTTTTVPSNNTSLTGSGLPTISDEAKYSAVAFTNAFLNANQPEPAWRANMARHATRDLAQKLETANPAKVNSGEITTITLYADGETNNIYDIGTTSMGTLRITVEIDPATDKWLVNSYTRAPQ